MYLWKWDTTQESSADLSSCWKNLIVIMLNWAVKIKSKEAHYTINQWIDYTNERRKPNRGCHKPALKCFYSFYFLSRMEGDIPLPRSVTGIYLSKSCKTSNSVSAGKIQIFAMV